MKKACSEQAGTLKMTEHQALVVPEGKMLITQLSGLEGIVSDRRLPWFMLLQKEQQEEAGAHTS